MHGWSTKRITYTGMFVAIAMVFSYLESMIPVNIAVPGIKLGLANMVTIVVMYRLRISDAWIVSLVRVVLSSLLFGNMTVMVYRSIRRQRQMCIRDRANSNGSTSHEEWQYHVVYAGAVHIGNYSRCVHRPGGGCACQKASVHRILE